MKQLVFALVVLAILALAYAQVAQTKPAKNVRVETEVHKEVKIVKRNKKQAHLETIDNLLGAIDGYERNLRSNTQKQQNDFESATKRIGAFQKYLVKMRSEGNRNKGEIKLLQRIKGLVNAFTAGQIIDGANKDDAAPSCKTIQDRNEDATSGYYWIQYSDGNINRTWCDFDTDGGGWTRCLYQTTAVGLTSNYLSVCRDSFFGLNVTEVMFKIYASHKEDSQNSRAARHILKLRGDIGDYFHMTERGQSWRFGGIDCKLEKIGGASESVHTQKCWFDHGASGGKAEMCLGGGANGHYMCAYSTHSNWAYNKQLSFNHEWRGNGAFEVFWRENASPARKPGHKAVKVNVNRRANDLA